MNILLNNIMNFYEKYDEESRLTTNNARKRRVLYEKFRNETDRN